MKKALLSVLIASSLISARAQTTYTVHFDGPSSTGVGDGTVAYDPATHFLSLQAVFTGLTGNTTASHIHAATAVPGTGTAGVATMTPNLLGFPLGVNSGTYSSPLLDLTQAGSFNSSYITANGGTPASAEAALVAAMNAGTAYWNIHTDAFPGGEIRGFLVAVPEPGTLALAGLGAIGLAARAWNKRRTGKA